MVGGPRQAIQIRDHRAVRVAVELSVSGLVAQALDLTKQVLLRVHQAGRGEFRLVAQITVHQVRDFKPRAFTLAADHHIHLRLPERFIVQFLGHHADVRSAQDDGYVHLAFDGGSRAPGLLHLRRIGGDADQVWLELVEKLRQRLIFHVGIIDAHGVSPALRDCAKVGQRQMWRRAGIDRQTEFRVD